MNAALYDVQVRVIPVAKHAYIIETYILCASVAISLHRPTCAESDRQYT